MIHPQIPLLLPVGGHASFDNFVIGPNAAACHHVHSACRSAGAAPVYLWGAEGTGKTHLLEAVLSDCLSQRKAAAYVPLVEPGLLDAAILEGLEAMDLVCIEDLDGIAGRAGWEEALFHLYNRCAQSACRLLLSARAAPDGLGLRLPDLQSRLNAGLVLRLEPLSDPQRAQALQIRATERGFHLSDEVVSYLMRRYPRGLHGLFAALEHLDRASLAQQRKITINFLREALDGH